MARFMRAGSTKLYWVPTIASTSLIPTSAEVIAGTRLDAQIMTINGFSFANQPIKTPDMATTFESEIPGKDQADTSDIEFYQIKGSDTIRTSQSKGTAGYMVILYDGTAGAAPAAADKADVFPATVSSNSKQYKADNSAATYKVSYSITAQPAQDVVLT
jgi:hypothetical protein